VFGTNHQPPSGAFTATGLDGCVSGTFSDSLIAFSPSGARVKVDRSYVCSSGATFTARVAIHLGVVASDGTQTVESTWNIVSSSAGVDGSGSGSGVNTGCSPVGIAFAECLASDGSISAHVH
jgi:hypothetical protein